jgi:hypothetical protein
MAALRNWFSLHWPVVAVALATGAVAVGAQVARPGFTFAMPRGDYPLRLVLPAARPLAPRAAMPPSTGMAVHYAPDADPFAGDPALAAAPAALGLDPTETEEPDETVH